MTPGLEGIDGVDGGGGRCAIGGMPKTSGYDVPGEQSITLTTEILDSPIKVIGTSNG